MGMRWDQITQDVAESVVFKRRALNVYLATKFLFLPLICMGGIVPVSSALTWRLHVDTGFAQRTMVSTPVIMSATHQSLWSDALRIKPSDASLRNSDFSRS